MSRRLEQINQLIKKELGNIIKKEIELSKDVLITLTRTETSPDLQQVKVYISIIPDKKTKAVLNILKNNIFEIQQLLNKRLVMNPVPKIIFVEDKIAQSAAKVEELLAKIKNIQ